jgi:hypothetical protein
MKADERVNEELNIFFILKSLQKLRSTVDYLIYINDNSYNKTAQDINHLYLTNSVVRANPEEYLKTQTKMSKFFNKDEVFTLKNIIRQAKYS